MGRLGLEARRAAGRGPPRGTARAVTGIEFVDSRSSAADAAFGGMFGDTRQKARADGNRGGLRIESGRRAG